MKEHVCLHRIALVRRDLKDHQGQPLAWHCQVTAKRRPSARHLSWLQPGQRLPPVVLGVMGAGDWCGGVQGNGTAGLE